MVRLSVIDNIIDNKSEQYEAAPGSTVRGLVEKYASKDCYEGEMVECYDADTGKTIFVPLEDDPSTLPVVVTVNGTDAQLDSVVNDGDSVVIISVPASANQATGSVIGAVVGAVVGMILLTAIFPVAAAGAAAIGLTVNTAAWTAGFWTAVAGFALAGAFVGYKLTSDSSSSYKDRSNLPDVKGSKNQLLIGNQIPMVIGHHLITPFVAGSPFSEFSRYDGGVEYISTLYCAGYAPLKITELEFDSITVAHNKSWTTTSGTKISIPTVMKGMIRGVSSSDSVDDGQISKHWSSNDVQIEILQQNPSGAADWGTLYNKTVIQNSGNSTPLYITDKGIIDVAKEYNISYHGNLFTSGLRTNSIRFSEQDPMEISVTLDFSQGCYKTRSESNKSKYYSIPCWVAIQWRVYDSGRNETSGAYHGEDDGWVSFDTINDTDSIGDGIACETFTRDLQNTDASAHVGSTLCYVVTDADKISSYVNAGYLTKGTGTNAGGYSTTYYTSNVWWLVVSGSAGSQTITRFFDSNVGWTGAKVFNIQHVVDNINSKNGYASDNSSTDEFRVTATVDLKSYIDKLIAAGKVSTYKEFLLPESNSTKSVQVRVVRVSPCYLNQASSDSGSVSAWTYQDVFSWKYITTKTFDEAKLDDDPTDLENRKPMSERDLRQCCYIAVKVKADTLQTISSEIGKMSCEADSFSPTWSDSDKSWYPASVSSANKYYSPLDSSNKRTLLVDGTTTAKEQFEAYRQNGEKAICIKGGNDYLNTVLGDVFGAGTSTLYVKNGYVVDSTTSGSTAYTRNVTSETLEGHYICANPASGAMLACVGAHAGRDAKGYDSINLVSMGEFFEDCSDVTDGTPYPDLNKGSLSAAPSNPVKGWVFTNTTDGKKYYYDGTSWILYSAKTDLLHIYFKCNAYVTQAMKLEDMLAKIFTAGRGAYVVEKGMITAVQDKAVPYPVGMISQANCLSGTNTRSYATPPSGLQIQFRDEDDGYDTNIIYAMADGEDRNDPHNTIESMSIDWVTNRYQIWSLGRYSLAVRLLSTEILTRKVGMEGWSFGFGSVVEVSDPTLLIGDVGGRITELIEDSSYVYGFIIDDMYEYKGALDSSGKCSQGVEVVQPSKYQDSRVVTLRMCTTAGIDFGGTTLAPTVGMTNKVLFEAKVAKDVYAASVDSTGATVYVQYLPKVGDMVAIGDVGSITERYRIKKITPDKNSKFDFMLVPYNEELYNYGRSLPSFQNNMSIPDRSTGDSFNLGESLSAKDLLNQMTESSGSAEANAVAGINDGTASTENPDCPVISFAVASQNGIEASCIGFAAGLRNTIKLMTWQIQKGTGADWVTVGTSTTGSFTYPFVRSTDGYPEASVLKNWSIRASVENIYSASSGYGSGASVNTDSYGTWIPQAPSASGTYPSINVTVNKRTVTLRMSQPASSTTLYGTISYGITIERSNPSADTKFYVPNLTADPYGSVDNYKDASATEPVWVSGSFSQTLPLYGQDSVLWKLQYSSGGTVVKTGYTSALANLPTSDFIAVPSNATKTVDGTTGYITWTWTDSSTGYAYTYAQESMPDPQNTTYLYRIQTKNVTTGAVISTTADVSVTVSPSTVEDIVNAAITENKLANDAVTTDKLAAGTVTAEKIFVKALSAITANLGQMSSGAIFGDANNYHILTEGTYTDPNTGVTSSYKAGEFKVGNSNGDYLQCKNNDDGTYTISLKSSAFQITSTGVDINGTIYAYENTGALAERTSLRRVVVSANGITLQRRESTSIPWSQATDVAKLIGDKYGNLLLTNDSTYTPDYVTPRRATDVIYHLDGNTLDTTGANTECVDGYGVYETGEVWTPDDKGKELNGFIRKNVGTSTYKAVAFWCKGKKFDACGNIINLDTYTSMADESNMNRRMTSDKTEWGLTAAQVSAGVVKYYQD